LITGESIKVVARPSGTEAKLKCYLEARVPTPGQPVDRAHPVAADRLAALRKEMAAALGVTA
jgi:phosphomannomutase